MHEYINHLWSKCARFISLFYIILRVLFTFLYPRFVFILFLFVLLSGGGKVTCICDSYGNTCNICLETMLIGCMSFFQLSYAWVSYLMEACTWIGISPDQTVCFRESKSELLIFSRIIWQRFKLDLNMYFSDILYSSSHFTDTWLPL